MQNTDFFQNNCVKGNKNMATTTTTTTTKKQKTKQSTDKLLLKMSSRDHKE